MQRFHCTFQLAGIFLASTLLSAAPSVASAALATRVVNQNPTGVCQSALPVYDGQIRKRPKAIQNEGTSPAYVTCSWTAQGGFAENSGNPTALAMTFSVNDGQPDHVSCLAVLGNQGHTLPTYTRGTDLHSNGGVRALIWLPADFGASGRFPSGLINVSCLLNPGVGINASQLSFDEEIGN